MASASYTNANRFQEAKPLPPVYVLDGDGELIFPGDPRHAVMDGMRRLSISAQRKLLSFARLVGMGEFDISQTLAWTDEQRHDYVMALPEAEV